ncbi:MAG TPA: STAS domain-containing protein [Candidatus Acidoferrales bacterium]|nr:STAS domain-containing protein [Candidatus Acidoferrales bacterium]
MKTSTRQVGDATIVDVVGQIDLHSSSDLRKVLQETLRGKTAARVVVNLGRVDYIDSSGVAALVEGLKTSMGLKIRFVLCGLGPAVKELLKLTQLLSVFQVCESEEQALRA